MNNIFHVHTYRCGHAGDEKEADYIAKAIELGATEIMFTDHAPFPGDPFRNRMKIDELLEYLDTMDQLKMKYERLIRIFSGLEIEYLPNFDEYYKFLRDHEQLDILVLGQHFSLMKDGRYSFERKDRSDEHKILAEGMIAGMETRLFDAVAHPDQVFRRLKVWDPKMEKTAAEIKQCAVENDIALEYNLRNLIGRKKKRVFRSEFWENMPSGLKVVYGVDAHSVAELEEGFLLQQTYTVK